LKRDIKEYPGVDCKDDTWTMVAGGNSYHQIENLFKQRCVVGKKGMQKLVKAIPIKAVACKSLRRV
jgi:hypothetical protein